MIEIFEKQKIKGSLGFRSAKGSIFSNNFYYPYVVNIENEEIKITLFDSAPLYNSDGEIVKKYKNGKLIQGIIEGTYFLNFLTNKEEIKINGELKDCIKLSIETLKEKYVHADIGNREEK